MDGEGFGSGVRGGDVECLRGVKFFFFVILSVGEGGVGRWGIGKIMVGECCCD